MQVEELIKDFFDMTIRLIAAINSLSNQISASRSQSIIDKQEPAPAQVDAVPTPTVAKRGRPAKKDVQEPAVVEAPKATATPALEDLPAQEEAPKATGKKDIEPLTEQDIRNAAKSLVLKAEAVMPKEQALELARKVIKETSGVDKISELKQEQYGELMYALTTTVPTAQASDEL